MKYIILFTFFGFSLFSQENYILIGPPGSGKGTFSSFMKKNHKYYQICPGDILRQEIKNNTELGEKIKPIVEKGDYIDDSIIFKIIEDQISYCIEHKIKFIIDGFPRSVSSFEFLLELLKRKNIVETMTLIYFKIDDQKCIERIDQRLVCFNCSAVFNMTTKMPKQDMTCDMCYMPLEIRLGDTVSNTVKRLNYYRKTIEPLVDLAKKEYSIIEIDAEASLIDCMNFYEKYFFKN